jgi:probable phosphoglycerate mutase
MSLRLFVIRHGETEWSLSGHHTGRADIPLSNHGEVEARHLGRRICEVQFSNVLTSPLKRARRTCELAGLAEQATIEIELAEWDNGDYEGRTAQDILKSHPGWNLFRDGCPGGEMPYQVSERADRLIKSLRRMDGNVALFTHGHFGRVLAARWIGLSIESAQHFLLDTASLSILSYQHNQQDHPAILLWNSSSLEIFENPTRSYEMDRVQIEATNLRRRAIERWENEGGEVLSSKASNFLADAEPSNNAHSAPTRLTMRAVEYDQYGDADVLHATDHPVPHRLPGQLMI